MTGAATDEPNEDVRESDEASAPGRTAFDALNPYGDFGGPEVPRGQLLVLSAVCVLAIGGLLVMGGAWAKDALTSSEPAVTTTKTTTKAATDTAVTADAAETATPPVEEPVEEPGEDAAVDAALDEAPAASPPPSPVVDAKPPPKVEEPPPPADAVGTRTLPAVRQRRPPPRVRRLMLTSVRDYSDAEVEGLDDALERGFLARLRDLAPDLTIERGRAVREDLGVRVLLMRLEEGGGGGAHDVSARCALATRPKDALPDGSLYAHGRQQGVQAGDALRAEAARRCGERLAVDFAPLARQYLK